MDTQKKYPGIFFLLVGPSGVGKGTIVNELKNIYQSDDSVVFPITATTRSPREGEENGKDYFFLSKQEFEAGLEKDEFLEHAIVHGEKYYGLPKTQIIKSLTEGKTVVRELDIQGLWNLKKIIPKENLHSIFIMPPSMEILEQRIRGRSTLPEEEIARRLESAKMEIRNSTHCDSIVVSEQGKVADVLRDIKNIFIIQKQIFDS